MTTIQELDKIDSEQYKTKPLDIIPIVKQLLNSKKFEMGIELAEKALRFTINNNGENETHLECAKFYYHYADALIRKCMESDEVLAMPQYEEDKDKDENDSNDEKKDENQELNIEKNISKNNQTVKKIDNSSNNISNNIGNQIQSHKEFQDSENENESVEENIPDEQIAMENLLVAERIYLDNLEKFDNENIEELKNNFPDVVKLYFELASVYQKIGELMMCRSDFKSAVEFFIKALQIRSKYDGKFSRAVAELYFETATAYDFDSKKCLLSYYKTKIIMEYHLKQELIKNNFTTLAEGLTIHEDDLNLEAVSTTHENMWKNRKITSEMITEEIVKHEEIEELVAIISDLYTKLDDVVIDIHDFEKFKAIQEEAKLQTNNQFTSDYDSSKVLDINSLGLVKKRARPDNVEELQEGGKRSKLEEK